VKAGSSTVEVVDGVVQLNDIVTFYRPIGEEPPAYRHVRNIVKLQNIIFNINLIFAQPEWASAPLVPDDQVVVLAEAKKPKQAKAAIFALIDNLAELAIISDPKTAKKNTTAVINSQNPDRLDVKVPVQISGNTDIISIDLEFGFFFGQALAA
jgi:phage tail sheath gpL-like